MINIAYKLLYLFHTCFTLVSHIMTITPYLKKRDNDDNYGIVNIRITYNRKSKYISTKISILERYWNPKKKEVRSSHPDSEQINQKIQEEIDKLKIDKDIKDTDKIVKRNKVSFVSYFEEYLNRLTKLGKLGTFKKYNTTIQHLKAFLKTENKNDLPFSDIDYNFIERFEDYLKVNRLKSNTRNGYLKCCQMLFNLALKEKIFRTYENPFLSFSFKREKVEKRRLSLGQIQYLILQDLEFGSLTYDTRMRFLVQIYGQGLRVSDLFTLRFKNINFDSYLSRINFVQYKTGKSHSIQLSLDLTKHIFYFVDKELYRDQYETRMYPVKYDGQEFQLTLPNLEQKLKEIRTVSLKEGNSKWEKFGQRIYDILGSLYEEQLKIIQKYSLKNPNKFIVPWLNEKYYEKVDFNDNTLLTKQQYNHLQSRITIYNRNLKRLEEHTGTSIRITSHTPRHTYTNLLLSVNTDVYSISKSLGHSNLSITENYLNDFDKDKVDGDNTEMFRMMNLSRMALPKKD